MLYVYLYLTKSSHRKYQTRVNQSMCLFCTQFPNSVTNFKQFPPEKKKNCLFLMLSSLAIRRACSHEIWQHLGRRPREAAAGHSFFCLFLGVYKGPNVYLSFITLIPKNLYIHYFNTSVFVEEGKTDFTNIKAVDLEEVEPYSRISTVILP